MKSLALTFGVSLLVVANLIGAGILGIPILAGIAGFWPSLILMVLSCIAMMYSAIFLARRACEEKDPVFNYPSLYACQLGNLGKHVATITNALVLYGLMTAYIAGGSIILAQLFGMQHASTWLMILFFAFMTILTLTGIKFFEKCNYILMIVLWGAFIVMCFIGVGHSQASNLQHMDLAFLLLALPMIITGFHFHNLIPTLATHVKYDKKTLYTAIVIGMILGLIINTIWLYVATSVIPLTGEFSLVKCFSGGIPASIPMNQIIHSTTFISATMIFSMLAILTSYVGNGLGLLGFCEDLSRNYLKIERKWFIIALTFIPPLVIAFTFQDIFLKAIGIVGGIGIVTLFGILPAIIDFKTSNKKFIPVTFCLVFTVILVIQIVLDLHIIRFLPPTI
ncbi:MAG: hypothetical protein GY710_24560 [Desulfobacteraceae bacterium]|nr:hypothetical protein [Desulfobacteraceae bacterium]